MPLESLSGIGRVALGKIRRGQTYRFGVVPELMGPEAKDFPALSLPKRSRDTGRRQVAIWGCEAEVKRVITYPDGSLGAVVRGIRRFRIIKITSSGGSGGDSMTAQVAFGQPKANAGLASSPAFKTAKNLFARVAALNESLDEDIVALASSTTSPSQFCNLAVPLLSAGTTERVRILGIAEEREALKQVQALLVREIDLLKLSHRAEERVRDDIFEGTRRRFLREQIRELKRELGESELEDSDIDELETALDNLDLPEAVRTIADRELERLTMIPPEAPEYLVSHNYLSWIKDLPWGKPKLALPTLRSAKIRLNQQHYGLAKVKEKILEYLAVMIRRKETRGQILLLVGPPGVGKSTLAETIAAVLKRPLIRIALGGVKDEAEIRGHRRTYVGALPGKIIQGFKAANSNAPVVLLDEIDKVSSGAMSDVGAAMLEVLDPEQNKSFTDNYLGFRYDLSNALFIATANSVETISMPLLDRMEVVELSSYTEEERIHIAKSFLIPSISASLGLKTSKHLDLSHDVLRAIIRHYTHEAGVRQLKRELTALGRKIVKALVEKRRRVQRIHVEDLARWLGPKRYFEEPRDQVLPPGVAVGLAYTAIGGDVLYVESSLSTTRRDRDRVRLTGNIGKVMKESAETAISFLQSHADALPGQLRSLDDGAIHIHLPDGATPKDGPSAGVAILCALASLLTGRHLPVNLAMTGEITLRGQVLPVGGIKEKILAAHRYGKNRILLPAANRPDLDEVPKEVRAQLDIRMVSTMREALEHVGLIS